MNVDCCNDAYLNPYEKKLSTFGKNVLHELVKKWNRDKIRNDNNRLSTPNYWSTQFSTRSRHHRKFLTFVNEDTSKSVTDSNIENKYCNVPDIEIFDVKHPQEPNTFKSHYNNVKQDSRTRVPRSNIVDHIVDTTLTTNHSAITTQHLLKTVNENNSTDDTLEDYRSNVNNNVINDHVKETSIHWENMFDSELFSHTRITAKETVHCDIKVINTNIRATNSLNTNPKEITHDINTPVYAQNVNQKQNNKLKHKCKAQQEIMEIVPKKTKKIQKKIKTNFHKQKYTKTIKNWLENVDHNNDNNVDEDPPKKDTTNSNIEISIEKNKRKAKKTVQALLANKDGIMKFTKPIDKLATVNNNIQLYLYELNNSKHNDVVDVIDNTSKIEHNNVKHNKANNILNITDNITNDNQITTSIVTTIKNGIENKDINTIQKSVVPISCQTPNINDITYNIINVNESNNEEINNINSTDSDLLTVLIYSNGYSQLSDHHTDDDCEPEGILINIQEQLYYFIGHQNFKNMLQRLLENNKMICFDGKSILKYLKSQYNLDTHNFNIIDVKIAACILDPDTTIDNFKDVLKLLSLASELMTESESEIERERERCPQQAARRLVALGECARLVLGTLHQDDLWPVFHNIEMKLLPIIADMEQRGVEVDVGEVSSMMERILTRMRAVEERCHVVAGKTFAARSSSQVRTLIYEELLLHTKCHVHVTETTAQGAKSTSEAMLRSLIPVHPLPKLILEYRHLHKAQATLAGIKQHIRHGFVKPTWEQTAAATGRIASNKPNLQAIPKTPFTLTLFPEPDAGPQEVLYLRSAYKCRGGWVVVVADYHQVECRVWAALAADHRLLRALHHTDLFIQLAALWLKKPESEISTEERSRTKRVVYATLYGAGTRTLMDILDLGYEQTLDLIATFNRTFPSLKRFGDEVVSRCALARGELRTPAGRRRRLTHVDSAHGATRARAHRQAVNFMVQGAAADVCKTAMVRSARALRAAGLAFRLVLQIHDELVFHLPRECLPRAAGIIKEAMEGSGVECGVQTSLPVSLSVGTDWAHLTPYSPPPPFSTTH